MNSTGILLFRADASTQIGAGHVMRCLALAQAWQDAGGEAQFVTAELPDELATRLLAEGMTLHRLAAVPGSHEDAVELAALAQQIGANWVVEDGYHFGAEYQSAIKEADLRLLAVDDYGHAEHYVADLVLNQNIYANDSLYPSREAYTRLLLGLDYVLLRREFLQWRGWNRDIPNKARKLLVTLGGGDPDNHTAKVIQAVQSIPKCDLSGVVVIGSNNPNLHMLKDIAMCSSHIKLVYNAANMPELMAWADIAISAGGSTCWELIFMGVPVLILVAADNQQAIAEGLSSAQIAVSLGNAPDVSSEMIAMHLSELLTSQERRNEMSQKGRAIADGYGAARAVTQLMRMGSLSARCVTVRQALPEDAEDLWQLANDPTVRSWSFSPQLIPLASHLEWYKQKLAAPTSRMWIAECDGALAGQIRYERNDDDSADIAISVLASYRGRGVGRALLVDTRVLACCALNVALVRGIVFQGNIASARMFRGAGFQQAAQCEIRGQDCSVFTWKCERTLRDRAELKQDGGHQCHLYST